MKVAGGVNCRPGSVERNSGRWFGADQAELAGGEAELALAVAHHDFAVGHAT